MSNETKETPRKKKSTKKKVTGYSAKELRRMESKMASLQKKIQEDAAKKKLSEGRKSIENALKANINLFFSNEELMNLEEDQAENEVQKMRKLMEIGDIAINVLVGEKEKEKMMEADEEQLKAAIGDISTCSFIGRTLVKALRDKGSNFEVNSFTQTDLQKLYDFFSLYADDIAAELRED